MPTEDRGSDANKRKLGGVTGKGFMPGQSGNPSGRPSRRRMSERYEELLEQALPEDLRVGLKLKPGATWGDAIALGQARAAIKGKTDAAREIADRVEGKARQQVDVKGDVTIDLAERIERARKAARRALDAVEDKANDPEP